MSQKCHTTTCRKEAAADMRGLCLSCYSSAKKLVDAKQTTWEDLERLGLCVSKTDAFAVEFAKRKKAAEEADRRPG